MTQPVDSSGFEIRVASYDDVAALTAMLDATTRAWVDRPTTADDIRDRLDTPNTDIAEDTAVAWTAAGEIAGFGHCWPAQRGEVRCFARTHPAYTEQGVGTALQRRLVARAQRVAANAPDDGPWRVTTTSWATDTAADPVLAGVGYTAVRYFQRMVLDFAGWQPRQVEAPPGVILRGATAADDEAIFAAFVEAFAQHWGEERPDPTAWWHDRREAATASYDPDLWLLALDGGQVAGFALALLREDADGETYGLVGDLGVRPAWRGRGLGELLLTRSLLQLRDRGLRSAALDVDTENTTGAVRLYTKVGMTSRPSFTIWSQLLGA